MRGGVKCYNDIDFIEKQTVNVSIILFENKSNIGFEGTFYDFYVVNIKSEKDLINGLTISLFELIISSQYLQIDEDSKWSLDDTNFKLYEVDYNEDEIEKNINETILDMKIMG